MTNPHKILLAGQAEQIEETAASAVTPGELLEYDASGDVQAHSSAGQNAAGMFARENPFQETASGTATIDTDYAASDDVMVVIPSPGAIVYAFLADGENVSKGDALESDGAGALQAHTPQAVDEGGTATYTIYSDAVVAYAAEDLDNSGGGSRARIKARAS